MKVEYEWHADDGRGGMEAITKVGERKSRPWWWKFLLFLLGVLIGAALVYSGYVAFA